MIFHCCCFSGPPVLRDKGQEEKLINRLKYRLPTRSVLSRSNGLKRSRTRDGAQRTLKGQNNRGKHINIAGKDKMHPRCTPTKYFTER